MGISNLEQFVRKQLPNGCPTVNLRNEIRSHKSAESPPTIVIDFRSLFEPVCLPDLGGVLCGGRYELVFEIVERFFSRLQQFGAELVFFDDGLIKSSRKNAMWIDDRNKKYEKQLQIIDAVDNGDNLRALVGRHRWNIPCNTQYPVKILAKQHGQFRRAITCETKKEMVAYANSVNALAIISNNSDLLIFPGEWRFWSSKDLNFETMTTREFSRTALRSHLGVTDRGQLALLATLASNNGYFRREELESFHRRYLGDPLSKFYELSEFVRQPHENLMEEVFGRFSNDGNLEERFQEGLDYYGKDYTEKEQSSTEDPVKDFLTEHGKAFHYKMWIGQPLHCSASFIDLRDGFGAEYPKLHRTLVLREAAVIVYHRRDHPDNKSRKLIDLKSHEDGYTEESYDLEFPTHVEPPTIQEMLSTDPEIHTKLAETKLNLYAWIISDNLDHNQLAALPPKLMPTLATLYFLVEHQVLELFEADLLLKVAHDVVNKSYDMTTIRYPQNLDGRAFRVAFLYVAICKNATKALKVVGLDKQQYPLHPQFDGVRFHNLYRGWADGERDLEQIRQWRIYANIF